MKTFIKNCLKNPAKLIQNISTIVLSKTHSYFLGFIGSISCQRNNYIPPVNNFGTSQGQGANLEGASFGAGQVGGNRLSGSVGHTSNNVGQIPSRPATSVGATGNGQTITGSGQSFGQTQGGNGVAISGTILSGFNGGSGSFTQTSGQQNGITGHFGQTGNNGQISSNGAVAATQPGNGNQGQEPALDSVSGVFDYQIDDYTDFIDDTQEHSGQISGTQATGNGFRQQSDQSESLDPIEALASAIAGGGIPGEDYAILSSVPDTGFTCDGLIPGYYADTSEESKCQVSFRFCDFLGFSYKKDLFK